MRKSKFIDEVTSCTGGNFDTTTGGEGGKDLIVDVVGVAIGVEDGEGFVGGKRGCFKGCIIWCVVIVVLRGCRGTKEGGACVVSVGRTWT